jgi:protein-S-isoprenylcysteine O-methyltransferase Ste14
MIEKLVLVIALLIILMIIAIIGRAIIQKQSIFGRPPIPVFFFILAKILVVINLVFLLMKGLGIDVNALFKPGLVVHVIALASLITGATLLFLSTIQLNKDLIFGLSSSDKHKLQTRGIFSLSRHPFYLGFLFVLFSSCLFNPNIINILSFAIAWLIHHFIMIKEEEFLIQQYGNEYKAYAKRVRRYINY